jgi:UDP:flavonoid glycosyltransferase YjiC (YdhE family)
MRIALAVEGTRGDVDPMLALGASLKAAGHEVVVCATPDFGATIEERGMEFRAVGTHFREYLTAHADALARGGLRAFREGTRYARTCMDAQFRSLPEVTEGADQLIGAGVQLAGPSAAALHGIPYRYVAYCPALLPSDEHAPILLPLQAMPRWANRLSWRVSLALHNGLLRSGINQQRARLGLAPVQDVYPHLFTERPLLAADEELAPLPEDCPFEVVQIRCLHPLGGAPLPPKLQSFLDQGPPAVYLGFGSMTDPDPAKTTRELLGAVTALGCRALISRGWAGLGDGPLPEGVMAIGSVSHAELFPKLAAVVHHGGAGTTTTAARAGVPQIVVPHLLDQFYWARRVTLLGLGPPPLPRNRLTGKRLAAALSATLENETLSERAHSMGKRLRFRAQSGLDPAQLLG